MENKIIIPSSFMGVNGEEALERITRKSSQVPVSQKTSKPFPIAGKGMLLGDLGNYIVLEGRTHGNYSYPDSLVSMERTHQNKNWSECWDELMKDNDYMLTIRQGVDFLNLLRSGKAFDGRGKAIQSSVLDRLHRDITEVKSPWRAEWYDAKFELKKSGKGILAKSKMYISYHQFQNGNLVKVEEPVEECLMSDKTPGISLDDWLDNANEYGLPKPDVKDGKLYYWYPRDEKVAMFYADSDWADLNCDGDPSYRGSNLGVRAVRKKI